MSMGLGFSRDDASRGARRVARRYPIVEELARGERSIVYRVHDAESGDPLALKCALLPESAARDAQRAAFERTHRLLAALDHPRIVHARAYGEDDAGPYCLMELVEGEDLRAAAPRPWREVCSLARDLTSALALLHARRQGVRVLRPEDVKLTAPGHAKLVGVGALTDFGTSPPRRPLACLAPEALREGVLNVRTELFALGTLIYWALTGRHAFEAHDEETLRASWHTPLRPPSAWRVKVPEPLDALVASLLRVDPRARPGSAAEVFARLSAIAELPAEGVDERLRVARSYFAALPFVGRERELARLTRDLLVSRQRQGSAVRVVGGAGCGRTRLLEEVGQRARSAGTSALSVNAGAHPGPLGTVRALVLRLIDQLPDVALRHAPQHRAALEALGPSVATQLDGAPGPGMHGDEPAPLWHWFLAVSRESPLLIAVDDVDQCDEESTTVLLELARRAPMEALLLLLAERTRAALPGDRKGLRAQCKVLSLGNLPRDGLEEVARAIFGEAAHVESVAAWLFGRSDGNPQHALALVRALEGRDVVRYEAASWRLPARPGEIDVAPLGALGEALHLRLRDLSADALQLAQALSLQRGPLTRASCRLLLPAGEVARTPSSSEHATRTLLDELTLHAILVAHDGRYHFCSSALREATAASIEPLARCAHPLRAAAERVPALEEEEDDAPTEPHTHPHERRIDVIEDLSGMRTARRLRPWLGGWLALGIAILLAMLRHRLSPKGAKPRAFLALQQELGARVAVMTGTAALALDGARAERLADTTAPLSVLPRASAARGLHALCDGLRQLARERPAEAYPYFGRLLAQYRDPAHFRRLAPSARAHSVAAATLARGALSVLRADGGTALDDARALEACGVRAYAALAPSLRHAYHSLRGEHALAAPHRQQMERQAAERPVAWPVELWLTVVALPTALMIDDLMEATQLAQRLQALARFGSAPALYAGLAALALRLARDDLREHELSQAADVLEAYAPRSFPGWSALVALLARTHNRQGRHAQAWALCEHVQRHVTDADRFYVALFLPVELEAAHADAGLGRVPLALMRLDALLQRFTPIGHPLTLGLLHEARARIAHGADMRSDYEDGLDQADALFRACASPLLIGRAARLAGLAGSVR